VLRRGNQPGRLAKKLIRRVGDADVALAGAETRPKVLKSLEDAEIQEIRAAVRADARSLEEEIAELRMEIDSRAERRERRAELVKDKVEQGRLWRSVGVQERIPQIDLSHPARAVVLFLLAALDFYVFAQAYAVLADVAGFGVEWGLGGLLGIAVFMAGVALAHAIKASILARAQAQMLKAADKAAKEGRIRIDPAVREQLVESRSSIVALVLTAAIFLTLSVAGVLVRSQGSSTNGGSAVVLFQALIPLVAVAVELYLHDPTERDEPAPNAADRRLERKLAKAERRLRIVAAQVEAKVAQIEKLYRVEEAILEVEQRDMGMRHSDDPPLGTPKEVGALAAASNGHAGALGTGSLAVGALGPGSLTTNSLGTNGRAGERDRESLERTLKMSRRT
jgi:hypothetical protein